MMTGSVLNVYLQDISSQQPQVNTQATVEAARYDMVCGVLISRSNLFCSSLAAGYDKI